MTCSKDGSFIVWSVRYCFLMMMILIVMLLLRDDVIRMEHREDMTRHNWRYTWATRYNEVMLASDWLILTRALIG